MLWVLIILALGLIIGGVFLYWQNKQQYRKIGQSGNTNQSLVKSQRGSQMQNNSNNKFENMANFDDLGNPFDALIPTVGQLQNYYEPNRGVFTSWWQGGKAVSRTKFNEILSGEQLSAFKLVEQHKEAVLKGKMRMEEYNLFIQRNQFILGELRIQANLMMQAYQQGRTHEGWQEELTKRSDHEREMDRIKLEHKCKMEILGLELQVKLSDSVQEVEIFREKEAIKLNNEFERWHQQVKFAILNGALANHEEKIIIQEKVDAIYHQIDNIRDGEFTDETKKRMINDREKIAEQFCGYRDSLAL